MDQRVHFRVWHRSLESASVTVRKTVDRVDIDTLALDHVVGLFRIVEIANGFIRANNLRRL